MHKFHRRLQKALPNIAWFPVLDVESPEKGQQFAAVPRMPKNHLLPDDKKHRKLQLQASSADIWEGGATMKEPLVKRGELWSLRCCLCSLAASNFGVSHILMDQMNHQDGATYNLLRKS